MPKCGSNIIVLFSFFIAVVSCASHTQDSFNPKAEWDAHVSKMPEPVWRLFYAVKHDLDYGFIDGVDTLPPKSQLSWYESVTSGLLAQVEASFS